MNQDMAGWTSGSIYTSLTSLEPKYPTKDNVNFWLQNINNFKIVTLGDVLKKAGYKMKYIMSNPENSGVDYLLRANNFDIVSEKYNNLGFFKNSHDLDIFSEAKEQVKKLSLDSKPFALFLTTNDTHFPEAAFDPRLSLYLKKNIKDYDHQINYAIEGLDYLIGDFISFLKQNNFLDNTVFYIFPDHKIMGNEPYVKILSNIGDRDLFLISNSPDITSNIISQADIPRIIIDSSGIQTNAKFISDYSQNEFDFNQVALFNKLIVDKSDFKNSFRVYKKNNNIFFEFSNNHLVKILLEEGTNWVNLGFNEDMVNITKRQGINIDELDFFNHEWVSNSIEHPKWVNNHLELTIHINENKITSAYFGNYLDTGVWFESNNGTISIDKKIIDNIRLSNKLPSVYKPKPFEKNIKKISINEYFKNSKRFIAHAGGKIDEHIYTNSLEALNQSYNNGIRIFELDIIYTSDGHFVAAHDWQTWKNSVGFEGNQIPTKKDFLKYKIFKKYTPLDMEAINQWFNEKKDAILVTDKINEPEKFSNSFIDKDRLMMELFSPQAVIEALNANILEAIPTGAIWHDLTKNYRYLIKKVNFFAVSVNENPIVIEEIIENNKKIYAFDINNNNNNENNIICSWKNFYYGFYIDETDIFNKKSQLIKECN